MTTEDDETSNSPLGPKLYMLEERRLPDGEWYADCIDGSDDLEQALHEAARWANFDYEDVDEEHPGQEVRIVVYERREVLCMLKKGDVP